MDISLCQKFRVMFLQSFSKRNIAISFKMFKKSKSWFIFFLSTGKKVNIKFVIVLLIEKNLSAARYIKRVTQKPGSCRRKCRFTGRTSTWSEGYWDTLVPSIVGSKFSNTRCLFGWIFFNLFSSQVVTTGTNSYLMRKERVTVYKVTLPMTRLSCQSSVPSSFHLSQRITLDCVWQFLLIRYAPSS